MEVNTRNPGVPRRAGLALRGRGWSQGRAGWADSKYQVVQIQMGRRKSPRAAKSFAKGPDAWENQCLRWNLSLMLSWGFQTWKPLTCPQWGTCPPLTHWLDFLKHRWKCSHVDKVDNCDICFYFKAKIRSGTKGVGLIFLSNSQPVFKNNSSHKGQKFATMWGDIREGHKQTSSLTPQGATNGDARSLPVSHY